MKYTVQKSYLRNALDKIATFVPPGSNEDYNTISLLATRDVDHGIWSLNLAAEGSDASFQTDLPIYDVESTEDSVEVLVYGKLLVDIAKRCTGDSLEVDINFDEGFVQIESGDTSWKTPFLIRSIDRRDAAPKTGTITSAALLDMIKKTNHAVGIDSGRPYLMILEISGGRAQACNGATYHELSVDTDLNLSLRAGILVSLMQLLRNWGDDIEVGESDDHYTLKSGSDLLTLAKPKTSFPDLHSIIVKPMKSQVPSLLRVDKRKLKAALEEVKLLSDADLPSVDLAMGENVLILKCSRKNGAEAIARVPAHWSGAARAASFEISSLKDLISSVEDDKLELRFGKDGKSANSPVVIEGDRSWLMLNQIRNK